MYGTIFTAILVFDRLSTALLMLFPTFKYAVLAYTGKMTSIFAFDYRYQSSPPYKSRLETKFIVHPPRSRIAHTISCIEIRRHFEFPIDIDQVPHTKVV